VVRLFKRRWDAVSKEREREKERERGRGRGGDHGRRCEADEGGRSAFQLKERGPIGRKEDGER